MWGAGRAPAAPEEPIDGTKQETDSPAHDGNMASAIYRRASGTGAGEFNPATWGWGAGRRRRVPGSNQPQGPNTQVHFSQQTRKEDQGLLL